MLEAARKLGNNLYERVPKLRYLLNSMFFFYCFFKPPQFRQSDMLKFNLYVETTNICNYKCRMCAAQTGLKRATGFMDFELYKKIIDEAADMGISRIVPQIWGEPLLHPRFVEMVQYAKGRGMYVEFTTNGLLMDEKMSRKLLGTGVDIIVVSFHGFTPEGYKRIHGIDGFDRVVKNIKALCKLKKDGGFAAPKVTIQSIITEDNFKDVHKVFSIFKDVADGISVFNCGFHPDDNTNDLRIVKFDCRRSNPCVMLFTTMAVSWDGRVGICCRDKDFRTELGNVQDGLLNLYNSEKMRSYRKVHLLGMFEKMPVCAKCVDYSVFEDSLPPALKRRIIDGTLTEKDVEFLNSKKRC